MTNDSPPWAAKAVEAAPWADGGADPPAPLEAPLTIPGLGGMEGAVLDLALLEEPELADLRQRLDWLAGVAAGARRAVDEYILETVMPKRNTGTIHAGGGTWTRKRPSDGHHVDVDVLFTELAILVQAGKLDERAADAACSERTVREHTWAEVKKLLAHDDEEVRTRIGRAVTTVPATGRATVTWKAS